jgi:hypothetical protein
VAAILISVGIGYLWLSEQNKTLVEPVISLAEITPAKCKAHLVMYDGTNVNLEKKLG